jgi:hypothetical protein
MASAPICAASAARVRPGASPCIALYCRCPVLPPCCPAALLPGCPAGLAPCCPWCPPRRVSHAAALSPRKRTSATAVSTPSHALVCGGVASCRDVRLAADWTGGGLAPSTRQRHDGPGLEKTLRRRLLLSVFWARPTRRNWPAHCSTKSSDALPQPPHACLPRSFFSRCSAVRSVYVFVFVFTTR